MEEDMSIRVGVTPGSTARAVLNGRCALLALAITLIAVLFAGACSSSDSPNQLKVGDVICLPQDLKAGKEGAKTPIEAGRWEVTDAQPNHRTGDPQVRLRPEGKPDAARKPWVGERKLFDKGAAVIESNASC
jgi:hypothetical protein